MQEKRCLITKMRKVRLLSFRFLFACLLSLIFIAPCSGKVYQDVSRLLINSPQRVADLLGLPKLIADSAEVTQWGGITEYYSPADNGMPRAYKSSLSGLTINCGLLIFDRNRTTGFPSELTGFTERLCASLLLENPALLQQFFTERMIILRINSKNMIPGQEREKIRTIITGRPLLSFRSVQRSEKGYGRFYELKLADTSGNVMEILLPGSYNLLKGNEKPELDLILENELSNISSGMKHFRDTLLFSNFAALKSFSDAAGIIPENPFGEGFFTAPLPLSLSEGADSSLQPALRILEILLNLNGAGAQSDKGLTLTQVKYKQERGVIKTGFSDFIKWYQSNFLTWAAFTEEAPGEYGYTLMLVNGSFTGFHMAYFRVKPTDFFHSSEPVQASIYGNIRMDNLEDINAAGAGTKELFKVLIK